MASLEKNSLRQPTHRISKGSVVWSNPCASTPSRSCSITESILRRQMDPTYKTKLTVQRQAKYLNRELQVREGNVLTYTPYWMTYEEANVTWPYSPYNIPLHISGIFVESRHIYDSHNLYCHETFQPSLATFLDRREVERVEEPLRRQLKKARAASITNQGASGGMATDNRTA